VTKKALAFIFWLTNGAIDMELDASDTVWGGGISLNIHVRPPYFWRRRVCKHESAKKYGIIRDGKTYCTRCDQTIQVR